MATHNEQLEMSAAPARIPLTGEPSPSGTTPGETTVDDTVSPSSLHTPPAGPTDYYGSPYPPQWRSLSSKRKKQWKAARRKKARRRLTSRTTGVTTAATASTRTIPTAGAPTTPGRAPRTRPSHTPVNVHTRTITVDGFHILRPHVRVLLPWTDPTHPGPHVHLHTTAADGSHISWGPAHRYHCHMDGSHILGPHLSMYLTLS